MTGCVYPRERVADPVPDACHPPHQPKWWERAVAAYPPYTEYQKKTDRQIAVFVLDSK